MIEIVRLRRVIGMMIPVIGWLLIAASCQDESRIADHEMAINEVYNAWVRSANKKDIDHWSGFVAPDAVFLPPGSPPLESITEIRDYYLELFQDPDFIISCEQVFVEVAESRDLAWSRGYCELVHTGTVEEVERTFSKWTKVWERQADGSWKCKLNIWNAHQPLQEAG